jgi:hypothetical protein
MNSIPNRGYILDVDLGYPPHLHDKHNDYPLAPTKTAIPTSALSDLQKDMLKKSDCRRPMKGTVKLCTTLWDKPNYIVHSKLLELYLKLGLTVKRINRVLSFAQTAWIAPYVQRNTEQRKQARTKFLQNFYKLKVNVYTGLENLR